MIEQDPGTSPSAAANPIKLVTAIAADVLESS